MTKLLGELVISIIFIFKIIVYEHIIIDDVSIQQLYTPIHYVLEYLIIKP